MIGLVSLKLMWLLEVALLSVLLLLMVAGVSICAIARMALLSVRLLLMVAGISICAIVLSVLSGGLLVALPPFFMRFAGCISDSLA